MSDFSVSFLQKLKELGCPGFRGSRIYLEEVEAWVDEKGLIGLAAELNEADKVDLEIRRETLRKKRFDNGVAEARYIARETIGPRILDIGTQLKNELRRVLEQELPLRLEGKPVEEIRPIMRAELDKLCAAFSAATRDLTR